MADNAAKALKMARLLALAHIIVGVLLFIFGIVDRVHGYFQPRPQGLLAFQYGGASGEDPGTHQNHVAKFPNEDGTVFKMAAKAK